MPFSTPRTLLIVSLAVTALGSAGLAWHVHRSAALRAAEQEKAFAMERTEWQRRLAELEERAKSLEGELLAAKATREPAAGAELAGEPGWPALSGETGAAPSAGRPGRGLAAFDNPEASRLFALQHRGQLDQRYAALFKSLGLSPDQLERFKTLLAEKRSTLQDVMAAARQQGFDPRRDRADLQQLVAQSNAEIEQGIQAVLGAAGYEQYRTYEQTLPQRSVVSQLENRLSYTSTPLTPQQSEQLVQTLAAAAPAPGTSAARRGLRGQAALSDEALLQASSVLGPDQQAALRQLQQEQQAQRQLQQMLWQQRRGEKAPSSAPAGPQG